MGRGTCLLEGCNYPLSARGYCKLHYDRFMRHGSVGPVRVLRNYHATDTRGPYDGCWEWTGGCIAGYGTTHVDGKKVLVHRAVYSAIYGPLDADDCVLHRCDNPPCFRPDHLFLGTKADNTGDMIAKGRNRRKLTEDDVRAIRARYPDETTRALGEKFGVHSGQISRIVRRISWQHVA